MPNEIRELRPADVVMGYWQELLVIEEDAEVLEPVYWEAA